MAVRIGRGAKELWRAGCLQFVVQARAEASKLSVAVARIGDRLYELDDEEGWLFVSAPVPLGDGLIFWLDAGDPPRRMIDRIVATVVAGLEDAEIEARLSAGGERCAPLPLYTLAIGAFAVLPHPGVRLASAVLPRHLVDQALSWVTEWSDGDIEVMSGGADLVLLPAGAEEVATRWLRDGRSVEMLGDRDGDRRHARVMHPSGEGGFGACPHVTIQLAGASVAADLDGAFEAMVARARSFAETVPWTFVDVAFSHRLRWPRPFWSRHPEGMDAAVVLADRVLDARPWQRLQPAQIARLPERTGSCDPSTGELRLGEPSEWVSGAELSPRFGPLNRQALGDALATRDVAWEAVERLPASEPPPIDEARVELIPVDARTAPLVSDVNSAPHPTVGVRPVDLFVLLRGEPYGEDHPLGASSPLLTWLDEMSRVPAEDHPRLRRCIEALAGGSTEPRWALRHRRIMVTWLARVLLPDLLELAGLEGGDSVRTTIETDFSGDPLAATQVIIGVIKGIPPGSIPASWEQLAANHGVSLRRTKAASGAAVAAAARRTGGGFGLSHMRTVLHEELTQDGTADESTVRDMWLRGGASEAEALFRQACERGALLHPQLTGAWERAWGWAPRPFYDALGVELLQVVDPALAWDRALAAGQRETPRDWQRVASELGELPEPERAEMMAASERLLASKLSEMQFVVAAAMVAAPAERLSLVAAVAAEERGRDDALVDVVWNAVDVLVDRIIRHEVV